MRFLHSIKGITLICLLLLSTGAKGQCVVGADVSWCTEMEANGKYYYNSAGQKTELMQLLRELGMSAIRLRVWVNPSYTSKASEQCYGSAYCNKADVVAKAKRAKAAGMEVMIDFHYSDFFADPSRQNTPNDWKGKTSAEVKALVTSHTQDVLNALKEEGIEPRWIQIGNETAQGMLSGYGDITWNPTNFSKFVSLYNAGYTAAKAVCPDALVMPHLNTGSNDNDWYFKAFKQAGGKMDMIALSHYPQTDDPSKTPQVLNTQVATQVKKLAKNYGVKVMIAETGVKVNDNESSASAVLQDLWSKLKTLDACAGIFYWEPELYNWWKPAAYNSLGWNAYNMGAFTKEGRPSKALSAFVHEATRVNDIICAPTHSGRCYNLNGQLTTPSKHGIYVLDGKKVVK